jgi:hypothetical protein
MLLPNLRLGLSSTLLPIHSTNIFTFNLIAPKRATFLAHLIILQLMFLYLITHYTMKAYGGVDV